MHMHKKIALPEFFNLDMMMDSDQCPALQCFWVRGLEKTFIRAYKINERFYKVIISQTARNLNVEVIPEKGERIYLDAWEQIKKQIKYQFRIDDDYGEILKQVKKWPKVYRLFNKFPGLRTMRNVDIFECVSASICSQNTSIIILNKMINNISNKFGTGVVFADKSKINMLPDAKTIAQLEVGELHACGLGYRAKYLLSSTKLLIDSHHNWEKIGDLSKEEAEKNVTIIPGVGPKVGALILSFGFGRTDVFAVDVWVKRGMQYLYEWKGSPDIIRRKAETVFGNYSVYVNTYVFYTSRRELLTK